MKRLILLVGPPGSGKSTLARLMLQCLDEYQIRVSQDEMGKEGHLIEFIQAINRGDGVLVDRMNFDKAQRKRYLDIAKKAGYQTRIVVLHENYETCLARCLARKNHETIKDETNARSALNLFFSKYERVTDDEADEVQRIWPEGDKPKAIWIDMDNTLSDATAREHYLQPKEGNKKRWVSFFEEMVNDPVNKWCKELILGMYKQVRVLICSGRPDNYKKQTIEWLIANEIPYHALHMRLRNDSRKDSIVKEIILEFEVKTKYNLVFAVDDRKQVIDQIRSHGVIVLDCAGEKGHF